jgi:UDP-N-acetyl-D-mannosaminuronate dehydrogenase
VNDIPTSFEFEGGVIFLSNMDFTKEIAKNSKVAPHIEAIMSRSHFIDTTLKTIREKLCRINMIIVTDEFLAINHIEREQANQMQDWILDNANHLREISIRTATKLADLVKALPDSWEYVAKVTLCRNR